MIVNIVKPFLPDMEKIYEKFKLSLSTGLVTNNSENVRLFENKLQDFYKCPFKPSVNCNGQLALYHLIQAWKHKLGYGTHDSFEVLVPSFTFSGTINALVTNNLKPVFCDVDDGLVLDLNKINIDSNEIKMILPVGAYGNLVNLELLQNISVENKLSVILDNAPAFGSKFKNKFPWEFGFSEMISFHATKIFNSMEGGANIVNDSQIADYLLRLRDFGQYEKVRGDIDLPGLNSKMTEICAIVGLANLENIDFILSSRAANVIKYLDFFGKLEAQGKLKTMKVAKQVYCPYLYFPIILNDDATKFVNFMAIKNISVRRYYTATHDLTFYRGKYRSQNLDYTNQIKYNIVAVPVHTIMEDDEISYIFDTISSYNF